MRPRVSVVIGSFLTLALAWSNAVPGARAAEPPGWVQLPDLPQFRGLSATGVTAWEHGFVIAADDPEPILDFPAWGAPVVLTSADGTAWERVDLVDSGGQPIKGGLNAVAAHGTRIVVGGAIPGEDETLAIAAAWWSDDGASWTPASVPLTEPIQFLVATATGFVAAGGTPDGPVFLASPDGAAWEVVDHPPPVVPAGPGTLMDLYAAPDGIVLYGIGHSGACRGAFWHSVDGSSWTPADAIPRFHGCPGVTYPGALFRTPDRWVATFPWEGVPTHQADRVMASVDGRSWHVSQNVGELPAIGLMFVEPAPGGFLGIGTGPRRPGMEFAEPGWMSDEHGLAWENVPLDVRPLIDSGIWFAGLAVGPENAIAAGRYLGSNEPPSGPTTAWIRTSAAGLAPVPGPTSRPTPPPTDRAGASTPKSGAEPPAGLVGLVIAALLAVCAVRGMSMRRGAAGRRTVPDSW